jgi:aspartyl-tRNA(Asn)/glutamyl-tRNA(Gln) amidotransferase subunit C
MPDAITVDEVRRVARLARLGLTDEQARGLAHDLNTILEHMNVLSRVDTTAASEYTAARAVMPLRADHGPPPVRPLATLPETFAPEMRDGFFVVPRLATHEDAEP